MNGTQKEKRSRQRDRRAPRRHAASTYRPNVFIVSLNTDY